MRKTVLSVLLFIFTITAFSQTRDLGMKSFINTDGQIKVAVKAFVSTKYLQNKKYLPFAVFAGCKSGSKATITRDDIVMIYNGKEYKMPNLKEFRKNYNEDRADLQYLKLTPNNIFPSEMGVYKFQRDVNFFPPRGSKKMFFTKQASITFRIGLASIVYFPNPGVKKGDKVVIKITDSKDKTIKGEVTVEF
jgi:hypothetical protein